VLYTLYIYPVRVDFFLPVETLKQQCPLVTHTTIIERTYLVLYYFDQTPPESNRILRDSLNGFHFKYVLLAIIRFIDDINIIIILLMYSCSDPGGVTNHVELSVTQLTSVTRQTSTDNPMTDNPMTDNPMTGNPMTGNPIKPSSALSHSSRQCHHASAKVKSS
jgi:hypothetical protein